MGSVSNDKSKPNQFLPLECGEQRFLRIEQVGDQAVNECLLFPVRDVEQSLKVFHLECLDLSLCVYLTGSMFHSKMTKVTRDL